MAKAKAYLLQVGTAGAAAGFLYLGFENTALQTTRLRVQSSRLPVGFDGFRIAHLSDTHSSSFGKNNRRLLRKVQRLHPDCIAYTGDLLDSYHPAVDRSLHLMEELSSLAPVFYIPGNHEARMPRAYVRARSRMIACGVTVLENETALLEREGIKLQSPGRWIPVFPEPAFPAGNPPLPCAEVFPRCPEFPAATPFCFRTGRSFFRFMRRPALIWC